MSKGVAIYARVSTEEQRERQSIDTQLEFAKNWCELNEVKIVNFYSDEVISGTVPVAVGLHPSPSRV